jgi:hypothetical protein
MKWIRTAGADCVKKEEFPGYMEAMQPGNSFPQICVVSEIHFVEVVEKPQDYR